jgi:hypothetical protein
MGLMQIKTATARSLGYSGSPAGLLDADTNLTYAVRYLAGAYKVANGDHSRAVGFYARGYYYDAKRKGILPALKAQPLVLEAKGDRTRAGGGEDRLGPLLALRAGADALYQSRLDQVAEPHACSKARIRPFALDGGTRPTLGVRTASAVMARAAAARSRTASTTLAPPSAPTS